MAVELGADTTVSIGVTVAVISAIVGAYKYVRSDIYKEIDKRVEKSVFETETRLQNERLVFVKEELLLRLKVLSNDIAYIKEKLDKED